MNWYAEATKEFGRFIYCPYCRDNIVQPRIGDDYCENCGWPDEVRKEQPADISIGKKMLLVCGDSNVSSSLIQALLNKVDDIEICQIHDSFDMTLPTVDLPNLENIIKMHSEQSCFFEIEKKPRRSGQKNKNNIFSKR